MLSKTAGGRSRNDFTAGILSAESDIFVLVILYFLACVMSLLLLDIVIMF